jgi:mono/diheme cytochrome c family protein
MGIAVAQRIAATALFSESPSRHPALPKGVQSRLQETLKHPAARDVVLSRLAFCPFGDSKLPTPRSVMRLLVPLVCMAAALCASVARGGESDDDAQWARTRAEAMKSYKSQVAPFIKTYCGRCHTGNRRKGGVSFQTALKNPAGASFKSVWERASGQIKTHDMPPDDEDDQPSDPERAAVVEWIAGMKRLSPKDPGLFVIRRLSKVEYGNTLHDLLGVDPQVARDMPDDVFGAGYTNTLSPMLMEQYLSVANEALDRALAPAGAPPTAVQKRLFGADPGTTADRKAAARKIARSLGRLAYRRPPSEAEVDLLVRVFELASSRGKSYPDSLRLMLKAILVSPQFLFITPGPSDQAEEANATGNIVPLDDYQLASRLSYLLWATMPDAELSALADSGALHDPAVLAGQVRRMIADPRSRALFDGFGAQWLGLDKLAGKAFDPGKFPQMNAGLRAAMYDEARLFFGSILRENRSLTTFIDSDYTFLNGTLAPIYGMAGQVTGPKMRRVKLSDANRGGILTMPGTLATSSFPNRTSPVIRGDWVLEQVLGQHIPPPPPDIPALDKQNPQTIAHLTVRQRTELHRSNPVCANCHKVLDPIGFGLENFDAIGRWRDHDDSGGAIDATGALPGGKRFSTPRELKAIIAGHADEFCRNLTGKLLAYALCRQLEGYDEVVADRLADATAKDGYRMQTLVVSVVTSYPFTHRRVSSSVAVNRAK